MYISRYKPRFIPKRISLIINVQCFSFGRNFFPYVSDSLLFNLNLLHLYQIADIMLSGESGWTSRLQLTNRSKSNFQQSSTTTSNLKIIY